MYRTTPPEMFDRVELKDPDIKFQGATQGSVFVLGTHSSVAAN